MLPVSLLLAALLFHPHSLADDGAPLADEVEEPTLTIPASLRSLALPLGVDVLAAMHDGEWESAAEALDGVAAMTLTPPQRADLAFLKTWCLIEAERPQDAAPWLGELATPGTVPLSYVALARGTVMLALGQAEEALSVLAEVSDDVVIADEVSRTRAEILVSLGRVDAARTIWTALAERPDPDGAVPLALWSLIESYGETSTDAHVWLERLWTEYPYSEQGLRAGKILEQRPGWAPSPAAIIHRGARWMAAGFYDRAIETVVDVEVPVGSPAYCEQRYTHGRSHYKKNRLSKAIEGFGDAGRACAGVEGDYGHRILYLVGLAEYRRGQNRASASAYASIAELYSHTTYADDGLTRAGISRFEEGDTAGAIAHWRDALARFPDGDTVAEATWRLAFAHYRAGRGEDARATAEVLASLEPSQDLVHVRAGQYWAARWRLYPDVSAPGRAVPDEEARTAAIDGWRVMIEQEPRDYYAVLAWCRLREVAPDVADELVALREPDTTGEPHDWTVRASFFTHAGVGHGVGLARVGLLEEAGEEWRQAGAADLATPQEWAWLVELRYAAGGSVSGHQAMHWWLKPRPLWSLGDAAQPIIRLAYPDLHWDLIQSEAERYAYPARLQHALVREESSFNPRAVSFVGARGLGQLMPSTARETAKWLDKSITLDSLFEPSVNVELGARYYHAVYSQLYRSPYLSLAGYNAGPHRVKRWLSSWDNPPADEFVERIPYRETRDYVKKVVTSWQVMRYSFDHDDAPFPDLSHFNHHAMGQ